MIEWAGEHEKLLLALAAFSLVCLVATLLIVPAILVRIPNDYFAHGERPPGVWQSLHPALRIAYLAIKNALGYLFILAGIAMLILPGQGLLTMLIGFLMIDAPGKYRLEKWVISRTYVTRTVNWLRRKHRRPPLL